METILLTIAFIVVMGIIMILKDQAQTKSIQKASVEDLEKRLTELYNIAITEAPKRMPGNRKSVREKADQKWRDACSESAKIVSELKERTGRTYKDAARICAEIDTAKMLSKSEIAITTSSSGDASVIKRAIVGGIIAGPAGAVVGAASAVDKNMRNRS